MTDNKRTERERVARLIARALGDNYADAFKSKDRWIAKRGMSGGRFREVNEPMQEDYLAAADAAITALRPADGLVERLLDLANQIDPLMVGGRDARLLREAATALRAQGQDERAGWQQKVDQAYLAGMDFGMSGERDAIVAWLRKEYATCGPVFVQDDVADAIEAGQHKGSA